MSVLIIATCRFDVMDFWSLALTQQTNVTVRILYGKVKILSALINMKKNLLQKYTS